MDTTTRTIELLGYRLRALQTVIEFLDEHGADLPEQPTVTAYGHVGKVDVSWYLMRNEGQKEAAAALVRIVGGKWEKSDGGDVLYFRQRRGDVDYTIGVDREAVCERIVTGTRKVTIPAVAAQPKRVTTVEDVEWRCLPLLADGDES